MMIRLIFTFLTLVFGSTAAAETLVTSRTVRAHTIVSLADLALIEDTIPGMLRHADEAVGLEARVILYAGRPVSPSDLGPAAIIERNQIVPLVFETGGLSIVADARALGRAGPGDMIRVMNLASKITVSGVVAPDGSVHVGAMSSRN